MNNLKRLKIPEFINGEVLYESHLYDLAHFSIHSLRFGLLAGQQYGFFNPFLDSSTPVNEIKIKEDHTQILIRNLFLITRHGYPIICPDEQLIEIDGEVLHICLNLTTLSDNYTQDGYEINLKWDADI